MDVRRWLDDEEGRAWLGLLAMVTLMDAALDRQLQRDSGLSHAQFGILASLSRASDRSIHMSDLAVLTSSSQSRLSHAVAVLEAKGWVTRSRCPVNGRAVHATLTDSGQQMVARAAPGHVEEVRRLIFGQLDREQVRSLAKIEQHVLAALRREGYEVPRLDQADADRNAVERGCRHQIA
jgi:DNA-binding MarR family transcriptional regulator